MRDKVLVKKFGWEKFVMERQGQGDLTDLEAVYHLSRRLI